jgi:Zn-finger domain-containing protein
MGSVGQFGSYYNSLVGRFFHALEWRLTAIKDESKSSREAEIIFSVLDRLISDTVRHEISLHDLESSYRLFNRVRDNSFSPNKYKEILKHVGIEEQKTQGYEAQLYGVIQFEAHSSIK